MSWGRTNSTGARLARRCIPVAAAAAALALAGAPAAHAGAAGAELLPDLRTLRPAQLYVQDRPKAGKTLLRLSNSVANRGTGPLELAPEPEGGEDCNSNGDPDDDRWVDQVIYLDGNGNGTFERDTDVTFDTVPQVGCRYFDPAHGHYHFEDFARYQLYRPRTGRVRGSTTKISFCLGDRDQVGQGSPQHYAFSQCELIDGVTGISPGWADVYDASLPGQAIDVTGLRPHRYCLVATADPDNHLTESNDQNNARRTLIRLNPEKGTVRRLGSC